MIHGNTILVHGSDLAKQKCLDSLHTETPGATILVSNSEASYFLSWQGNQGVSRRRTEVRRTSKHADWSRQGGKGRFRMEAEYLCVLRASRELFAFSMYIKSVAVQICRYNRDRGERL
jgi:hypothetical protein